MGGGGGGVMDEKERDVWVWFEVTLGEKLCMMCILLMRRVREEGRVVGWVGGWVISRTKRVGVYPLEMTHHFP